MLKKDSNNISEDRLKKKKKHQTTTSEFHVESSSLFLTEQVCLFSTVCTFSALPLQRTLALWKRQLKFSEINFIISKMKHL